VHEKSLKLNEILKIYIKYTAACLAETRSLVNNMLIILFKTRRPKRQQQCLLMQNSGLVGIYNLSGLNSKLLNFFQI
jgi:hypothetical protein